MNKIESKIDKSVFAFGEAEFNGTRYFSLTKKTPGFKKEGKVIVPDKFQVLSIRKKDFQGFRDFLKQIISMEVN